MQLSYSNHVSNRIKDAIDEGDDWAKLLHIIDEEKLHLYYGKVFRYIFPDMGCSILMYASKRGRYDTCRGILELDSECISCEYNNGYTALHYSAFHGHYNVTQLLIQYGADIFKRNKYREMAYESALVSSYYQLYQDMLSHFLCPSATTPGIKTLHSIMHRPYRDNMEEIRSEQIQLWMSHTPLYLPANVDRLSSWYRGSEGISSRPDDDENRLAMITRDLSCLFRSRASEVDIFCGLNMKRILCECRSTLLAVKAQDTEIHPWDADCTDRTSYGSGAPTAAEVGLKSYDTLSQYMLKITGVLPGGLSTLVGKEYSCFAWPNCASSSPPCKDFCVTIGRSRCHSISLSDLSVSNYHARLEFIDSVGLFLSDSGSKHGTFLDDELLTPCTSYQLQQIQPHGTTGCGEIPSRVVRVRNAGSVIRVGRVLLSLVRKTSPDQPAVLEQRFKPNARFGRALYEAASRTDSQCPPKSQACGVLSVPSPMTGQLVSLMMNIPKPIFREIGQPRACYVTGKTSGKIDSSNHGVNVTAVSAAGGDMKKESFVGRSILRKMGWQDGVKLGRIGGAADGPLEVSVKKNRLGLGASEL